MAEKKEEKREEKHPKVDGMSPAQNKTTRSWIMNLMILGIFAGILTILLVEVVPGISLWSSSEDVVVVHSGTKTKEDRKEERVKIPLLGLDQWSSEATAFNMARIPKGKEFFLDCPLGGQVLFSDGESGPCMKEGGYLLKRGIVRFKGGAGEYVTICWDGECEPEVRTEVSQVPKEIEGGGGYPRQDLPPHPRGWNMTPQSIEQDRLREEKRVGANKPTLNE